MKFKRNLSLYVTRDQTITVPDDEFWKFSIFIGNDKKTVQLVNNNQEVFRFGGTPGLCFGGGTKVFVGGSAYITGAAFTAD